MEDPYELQGAEPERRRGHVVPLFAAMALLLIATFGGTFWVWRLGVNNGAVMRAEQGCQGSVQETLETLKDAETGERGFILTGDESYLQPYNSAMSQLPADLSDLERWVAAGELRHDDADFIEKEAAQKVAELK